MTVILIFCCRSTAYDSSMGACLHVLHSSCPNDVVEFTAGELISVFQQSLQSTESPELMVSYHDLFFEKVHCSY